jgi:hypothetical protein
MATSREKAIDEARALAHLGRPVYLIYNGTSAPLVDQGINVGVERDFSECVKDYLWSEILRQHNPTTKELTGFLYRAAKAGLHISVVAHSQGNLILRNALKTLRLFEEESWYRANLAWVATGSPINPEEYGVAKVKDLLNSPSDPISVLRDPMSLKWWASMTTAAHDFINVYEPQITEEYIWRHSSRDDFIDGLMQEPAITQTGTLIIPPGDYYY